MKQPKRNSPTKTSFVGFVKMTGGEKVKKGKWWKENEVVPCVPVFSVFNQVKTHQDLIHRSDLAMVCIMRHKEERIQTKDQRMEN